MNKTSKLFALVALALLLTLSGCKLPASQKPAATTPTTELGFMTPKAADVLATQTAQANQGPAVATNTPENPGGGGDQAGGGVAPTATAAPQQAPAARTIPTLVRPATYPLQKGEWPICIARRYDVNLNDFFNLNGLNMESRPATGAVLKLPSGGNWNSSAHGSRSWHEGDSYTVKAGDTLYTIACYFGDVSPEAILAANGLGGAGDIKSGATLKIP